ncbi:MAG: DNA-3-methyladenine glycosylase [Pseudanabaenaceae cyanobacterium bins.68]|nr:DNA-3-methyladenine glycosylase [Pseudanabaenaceae cyanobacterium bins.68]
MLEPSWFARPAVEVAPDLLGCTLVRAIAGTTYRGVIVETEAYDATDPACHGYKRQTPRNQAIFGEPGSLYVYLIYGVYHCVNIVSDRANYCSGVLLRALELEQIPDWVDAKVPRSRVAAGPGKLCRTLQIDRRLNGLPLGASSGIWLEAQPPGLSLNLVQTTRIGLSQGTELPWRWYVDRHPAVSKF